MSHGPVCTPCTEVATPVIQSKHGGGGEEGKAAQCDQTTPVFSRSPEESGPNWTLYVHTVEKTYRNSTKPVRGRQLGPLRLPETTRHTDL
jgi:hypothetical protein